MVKRGRPIEQLVSKEPPVRIQNGLTRDVDGLTRIE
jgi:hypothetical protein